MPDRVILLGEARAQREMEEATRAIASAAEYAAQVGISVTGAMLRMAMLDPAVGAAVLVLPRLQPEAIPENESLPIAIQTDLPRECLLAHLRRVVAMLEAEAPPEEPPA